jgi:hypothetical protein
MEAIHPLITRISIQIMHGEKHITLPISGFNETLHQTTTFHSPHAQCGKTNFHGSEGTLQTYKTGHWTEKIS